MIRVCTYGLVAMLMACTAYAQQQLRVTVLDKDAGQPVFLAYVNTYSSEGSMPVTVQTDETGIALINFPQYPCTVEVVAAGYDSYSQLLNAPPVNPQLTVTLVKKFNSLNEVVVTGLVQPQRMKDALSVYQVIPKAVIEAQGSVTLDEVLKNQLNVRVSNDNILGSSAGMQGMTGNKLKVLIDGIPLNGREGGNINLAQINMSNVERIEMIQGPMSVIYGTDALGGVINIITRKEKKPFNIFVNTHLETIGKYNVDGGLTFKAGKRSQLTLAGGRNFFGGYGYIDVPVQYLDDTLKVSRSQYFKPVEQYIANAAYSYTAASGFKLDAATDFLNEKVTNKGSIAKWDPFESYVFDEYYRTKRLSNRLSMQGKLGKKGQWQSQNGYVVYGRTRTRVKKDMVSLEETLTAGRGDQDTSTFKDVFLRGSYTNNIRKLTYTAGYDFNLQYAYSLKIAGLKKDLQDYAVYANVSMPVIADVLTAQIGGRASHNSSYAPPVIPNVNLLFTPSEKWQLRASYTQGFRAPSLKEMYLSFIDNNHNIIGSTGLKAEQSSHGQLSASYQALEDKANYLQLMLVGYYNDVRNGIVLVPVHPDDPNSIDYIYGNLQRQRNAIISFNADGQFGNFHGQIGYALNHTFAQAGNYSAFSAQESTTTMQYRWRKPGLTFSAFYKYMGTQPYLLSGVDGSASFAGSQAAYHFCDASVERSFFDKKLQLIIGAKNLLNTKQVNVTGIAVSGAHTSGTGISFIPRSIFTTAKFSLN